MKNVFLSFGALLGFLSVGFGAFGAHALKDRLDSYALGVYQTAVQYQFFHTFALLAVGLLLAQFDSSYLRASGWLFLTGTIIFSGSLYILAMSGVKVWGAVTPVGGVLLLLGWASMFIAVWQK